MDIVDSAKRSRMMAGIRSKDTRPELQVRLFLHGNGFRYRLHTSQLPGKPDIVLPKYRTVVFVHGCFWHRHFGCPLTAVPKTNTAQWLQKFASNIKRDQSAVQELRDLGWRVLVVWECELRPKQIQERLQRLREEIREGQ